MALQNKQRFAEAAQVVQTGIEALHDTPDTILEAALQNTAATGYRRMGALFEASDRLYDALHRVETFSGADSPEGKRMRAFLYNNLGNVYTSMTATRPRSSSAAPSCWTRSWATTMAWP